jgi:arylsulfatase A-like enzyme
MDWTTTILSVAGSKGSPNFPLDGIDLLPVMTGSQGAVERTLCWRSTQRTNQKAILSGDWKYLRDEKGEYLFNLRNDQQEKNNLREKHPETFDQLKKKYAAWEREMLPPIPLDQN